MQHILNIPLPIIFTFLEHLSVEEVWELRAVCKSFHHICTSYLKEKLKELCLDKTWFYNELFGRTVKILQNCRNLKVLTMELQQSISTDKVLTIFHSLLKSNCNLSECSWKSFRIPDSSLIPNITENFLSVRKLCLVDLVCSDWQRLFVCLLQPRVQYATLQHLSLQLPRYDGVDLLYLGRNCPNVTTLNVSYCSQLRSEYLEAALRGWCKLKSAHLLYVSSVKNSTVRVLIEYCPSLVYLGVRGTQVTLDALLPLSQRHVNIDIIHENHFIIHPKLPLQS